MGFKKTAPGGRSHQGPDAPLAHRSLDIPCLTCVVSRARLRFSRRLEYTPFGKPQASAIGHRTDASENPGAKPLAFLSRMNHFFENGVLTADRCHHGKEEAHLFPAMEARGFLRSGGPTGVMLDEHEQGRACVRGMADAIDAAAAGDAAAQRRFLDHAAGYVGLLR